MSENTEELAPVDDVPEEIAAATGPDDEDEGDDDGDEADDEADDE